VAADGITHRHQHGVTGKGCQVRRVSACTRQCSEGNFSPAIDRPGSKEWRTCRADDFATNLVPRLCNDPIPGEETIVVRSRGPDETFEDELVIVCPLSLKDAGDPYAIDYFGRLHQHTIPCEDGTERLGGSLEQEFSLRAVGHVDSCERLSINLVDIDLVHALSRLVFVQTTGVGNAILPASSKEKMPPVLFHEQTAVVIHGRPTRKVTQVYCSSC
jgi:hypothetical protein